MLQGQQVSTQLPIMQRFQGCHNSVLYLGKKTNFIYFMLPPYTRLILCRYYTEVINQEKSPQ